jgi:hypothetical protein
MKIQYLETSITITADAMSNITNEIRYSISADLTDGQTLAEVFENKNFTLKDGKLTTSGMAPVPNMWDLFDEFEIEANDVGKTVKQATDILAVNLIYMLNLLELELEKWSVK